MNLLIAGCGTVGSSLANALCRMGHSVSIIDRSKESFNLLEDEFSGFKICGNPIDQDVLRRAGIEGCDAVAAMTPSDNVNVMVSQIAKELFGVKKVLTRIYDPQREAIFAAQGLHIICPTALTVDSAIEIFTGRQQVHYIDYGGKSLALSIEPSVAEIAKNRVALAVLHTNGSLTLVDSLGKPKLSPDDRLITAHIVEEMP